MTLNSSQELIPTNLQLKGLHGMFANALTLTRGETVQILYTPGHEIEYWFERGCLKSTKPKIPLQLQPHVKT